MKKISKFTIFLLVFSLTIISFISSATAAEQSYPTKPIKIVVGYNPGGGNDVSARIFAKYAEEYFGQPFVVTNISGAGGSVAGQEILSSKPDGYSLFWHHDSMHVAYHTGVADFTWDSFIPICQGAFGMDLMVVKGDSPFNTIDELMAYANDNPNEIRLAANVGATTQFLGIELNEALKDGNFIFVATGGDSDRVTKLLGGFLDFVPLSPATATDFIASGKIKALAVTARERSEFFPDIPTLAERGFNSTSDEKNWGLFAPPGVSEEIVDFISENFKKLSEDKRVIDELNKFGFTALYRDQKEFRNNLLGVDAIYYKLARAAGILKARSDNK